MIEVIKMWLIEAIQEWLYYKKRNRFDIYFVKKEMEMLGLKHEVEYLKEFRPLYVKYLGGKYKV